jgi:predicted permease
MKADLRFALRVLGRTPLLTVVVILSLGLGIGANTAIFSFLHQVVLSSLPVERPQELVVLKSPGELKGGRSSTNNAGGMDSIFSYRTFRGLEKHSQGVAGIAGFRLVGANLSFRNQTVDGSAMLISGSYFPLLGVAPRMGRLLGEEDDVHGAGRPVVVLSHAYWQNRLGGQAEVLIQPLRVNGRIFTIVGVTPRGFVGTTFGEQPDVFVPLCFKPAVTPGWDGTDRWNDYWLYLFARLQPGSTRERAEAALNATYGGLVEEQANSTRGDWPVPGELERFRKSRLSLADGRQGQSSMRDGSRVPILILMASTALVLLIAIANTANVLLARGAQRMKELAIRTALGAGRVRLMRQVLTEAILLSIGGGLAGVLLAAWTVQVVAAAISGGPLPEDLSAGLQWPVLLFACGVSVLTGVLCGAFPAWEAARSSVAGVLKDQAGRASGSLRAARVRTGLVCAQVTISALLLIPTGLFLKSLINLVRVDLGVNADNLVTFRISPELNGYRPEQSRALFSRIEEELGAAPGMRHVAASMVPLISGSNWGAGLTVEGYSRDPSADTQSMLNVIGSGFFSKMGIPLLAGREFTERDTQAGPKVAVVNETFARYFFKDRDPIGRKFIPGRGNVTPDIEIVGVVKDSHYAGVKQTPPRVYYTPWRQSQDIGAISFYVRSALLPSQATAQLRRVMQSLDPDLPLEDLRTFDEQVSRNIRTDRLVLQLSAAFSIVATLLAMLGLYGVMAYSVTRRTREIGIRMALGAERGSIRRMVFRELLIILAVGLAAGIPSAIGLARLAESLLFGVRSFDGLVVAAAAGALTLAAILAGYLPARRATRVNPIVALRYE